MEVIIANNRLFCFEQEQEIREHFYERIWIIINNYNKYKDDLDKLVCLSKIWINVKYLKCTYNKNIMEEIKVLNFYDQSTEE